MTAEQIAELRELLNFFVWDHAAGGCNCEYVVAARKLLEETKPIQGATGNATPCLLCGQPTTGAVGAAGLRWPFLCQPCKDAEDAALLARVRAQGKILQTILPATTRLSHDGPQPAVTHTKASSPSFVAP